MILLIFCSSLLLIVWAIERFYLRGSPLEDYPAPSDPDVEQTFTTPDGPGPEHEDVVLYVRQLSSRISPALRRNRTQAAREVINSITDGRYYSSDFVPVDAGGVPAEWVLAPGSDSAKRVLYIHGWGFIMGSPKSHRTITSKFSEISGCAVLSIDYRLLPEHRHMDSVEDCRNAYQWILDNGPDGPEAIRQLFVGGDSAGGNLVLALTAWVRDSGLRLPEAVIALSPLTDSAFSSASINSNEATDVMLAPVLKPLKMMPRFFKSWWVVFVHRLRPSNPIASPLRGDLSGLPPLLIQASEAEMLLDDARRYAYKACASGSPVKLQTWTDMVHVWQIFYPELPQAREAWVEIENFLKTYSSDSGRMESSLGS
ncbi:MAG: alpha/beta hydrolase fold domain-containing protein [Xanthomonadales bacterium]|nr:alpha/beta hydrolase fold domain-containing protein [Xanthomonadales bacterium]